VDAADRQRAARRGVPERWRMHGGRGVVNRPAADSDPQMQGVRGIIRRARTSRDGGERRVWDDGTCVFFMYAGCMPGANRLGATIVGANVRHLFDEKSDYGE